MYVGQQVRGNSASGVKEYEKFIGQKSKIEHHLITSDSEFVARTGEICIRTESNFLRHP